MNNAQLTDPNVAKCRYCNREGHSRHTRFSCAMNPDKLHPGPYVFVQERSEGQKKCGEDTRPRQRPRAKRGSATSLAYNFKKQQKEGRRRNE